MMSGRHIESLGKILGQFNVLELKIIIAYYCTSSRGSGFRLCFHDDWCQLLLFVLVGHGPARGFDDFASLARSAVSHKGMQVAHLGQARLDVFDMHFHTILKLANVLRAYLALHLTQRLLESLQFEGVPEIKGRVIIKTKLADKQ